jgi:hypothetical protein
MNMVFAAKNVPYIPLPILFNFTPALAAAQPM